MTPNDALYSIESVKVDTLAARPEGTRIVEGRRGWQGRIHTVLWHGDHGGGSYTLVCLVEWETR